jgi:hypothetical protein
MKRQLELSTEADTSCSSRFPHSVRDRINSFSNSANPLSTVSISRQWGVVVSAQAYIGQRAEASSRFRTASSMFRKSRVDRVTDPARHH